MEERSEVDKMDEIMLPGFRFHPTDEELVGFYLKRKVQQRPVSIELIKQLDIYKYDPWDLPKLATIGEKEWYFYCPRDRKYRNSTRPNRVTGAGFWKATGTDRPIYSSEGSKCIGLKKSLVFYKGRAAKGTKTDWMMHEFRLPSLLDSASQKTLLDKTIPDSWAICRIFKKASTNAHRAVSHSWVSSLPETTTCTEISLPRSPLTTHFNSQNISLPPKACSSIQYSINDPLQNSYSTSNFSPNNPHDFLSNDIYDLPFSDFFTCSSEHPSTMSIIMPCSTFKDIGTGALPEQSDRFTTRLPQVQEISGNDEEQRGFNNLNNGGAFCVDDECGGMSSNIGMPMRLPATIWKSTSSPCPSEMSTNYSYI